MPVRPLHSHERVTVGTTPAVPASPVYSNVVQHYDVGDLVSLPMSWADSSGALVTPTVACAVRKPDGTKLSPAVDAAGTSFSALVTPDAPGQWWYSFTASGTHQGVAEHLFVVRDRRV